MKIYIDLFFIQETIIMFVILVMLKKLSNATIGIIKILIISCINSVLTIIILICFPKLYNNMMVKVFLAFLMIRFGFNYKLKEEIISKVLILLFTTIFFGGIGFLEEGNLVKMLITFCITGIIITRYKLKHKKIVLLEAATCFIEFKYNEKIYKFKALVDTGHDVQTIYDEEVIFIKKNLFNIQGGEIKSKRIVSYKTVSGIDRKIGIKINNICITYGSKKVFNNAVIVSTPNILNHFDAIIGLNLIEGGWLDGNINFIETKSKKIIY